MRHLQEDILTGHGFQKSDQQGSIIWYGDTEEGTPEMNVAGEYDLEERIAGDGAHY